MQLSRGSRDSTVMLLFLQKGNFSVPWDGTGLPLWAARAGGDRGHGCTQGRADPLGLELSRGPSTHQQLLWGSPLSLCIPKSYPHLTFAVRFHGARPSHPASARPLWDSLSPPRSTPGSAEQGLPAASAWSTQECGEVAAEMSRSLCSPGMCCLCPTGGTRGVVLSCPPCPVPAARPHSSLWKLMLVSLTGSPNCQPVANR